MDTIICDIAKNHMKKDFNEALRELGLFISDIIFDDSINLTLTLIISIKEEGSFCA